MNPKQVVINIINKLAPPSLPNTRQYIIDQISQLGDTVTWAQIRQTLLAMPVKNIAREEAALSSDPLEAEAAFAD